MNAHSTSSPHVLATALRPFVRAKNVPAARAAAR